MCCNLFNGENVIFLYGVSILLMFWKKLLFSEFGVSEIF